MLLSYVRAFHVIAIIAWMAGLLYLPRLFVYHAMTDDRASHERFIVMERKLYWGIMTPGGVLTILFGVWLWFGWGFTGGWLHAKVALTALLVAYHVWCGRLMLDFRAGQNRRSHVWFRWFNEAPTLVLFAAVILVVVKPI